MEKLGISPAGCVVFEDTEVGLIAAANAGMRPFYVRAMVASAGAESLP